MCLTYTDLDRTDQVSHMSTDYYTDHIDHTSQLDPIDHIDRRYVINDHTCYQDTDFDHTDQVCHMFTDHIDHTIQHMWNRQIVQIIHVMSMDRP